MDRYIVKLLGCVIVLMLITIGALSSATNVDVNFVERLAYINDPYDVELSCDNSCQDVKQGDTALFIVEITNTGALDDTYDVTASSIEDIVCEVNGVNADQYDPYEISLAAGESITFEVTAEVAESVPEGKWRVVVDARSQSDTAVYDGLILTANVVNMYGVELSCDNSCQDVKQGDTATFVVEITNTGTRDDTYDVIASSIEGIECKINGVYADQYDPYEISLAAGESITFEVTAEVAESVSEEKYSVEVEARSQNDTTVCDSLTLTVNVKSKNKQLEEPQFIQILEILMNHFPVLARLLNLR